MCAGLNNGRVDGAYEALRCGTSGLGGAGALGYLVILAVDSLGLRGDLNVEGVARSPDLDFKGSGGPRRGLGCRAPSGLAILIRVDRRGATSSALPAVASFVSAELSLVRLVSIGLFSARASIISASLPRVSSSLLADNVDPAESLRFASAVEYASCVSRSATDDDCSSFCLPFTGLRVLPSSDFHARKFPFSSYKPENK